MATQNYFKVKNGLEFPSIETLQTTDNTGPSVKPSLNLDFAKTKSLDPRITFSRASTATYYDGKTTAKAEENLLTYSQQLNNAIYYNRNVTITSGATAPDGTTTAWTITPTANSNIHDIYQDVLMISGLTYTMSVYAKASGGSYIQLAHYLAPFSNTGNAYANFDIANGVVTVTGSQVTASISYVGSGWYRCSITGTATATATGGFYAILINSPTTSRGSAYTSSGTESVIMWGAQFEQRSSATAYTATTSSPITNYIPVLQTAGTNTARFDHDPITGESKGLLIEESRTNLLTASQDFGSTLWGKTTVRIDANMAAAPDGSITADLFTPTGGTGTVYASFTATATQHTASVFAKGTGSATIILSTNSFALGTSAVFNLSTGVASISVNYGSTTGSTVSMTPVGNGWYRCALTVMCTAASWYPTIGCSGTSPILFWGAQVEAGAFATSYIPTTLTYTGRASTATYKGSNGLIQTAAVNAVRYEPNSSGGSNILLENASSNLVTYSASMSFNASQCTAAKNSDIAPDGSMTATALIETTANTEHSFTQTFTSGSNTSISVYVKAKGRTKIGIGLTGVNPASTAIVFDTSTNTFSSPGSTWLSSGWVAASSYGSTHVGGGWYRIWMNYPGLSTGRFDIYLIGSANNERVYTGDGVSGIYVWGAQYEIGASTATSYIPSSETFTGRSSTGTYIDSTGTVRTAASGQARYTYNQNLLSAAPKLLLESSSTNLNPYGKCDGWVFEGSGGAVKTNNTTDVTAPDGTSSATKVDFSAITNYTFSDLCWFPSVNWAGTTKTFSVWVNGPIGKTISLKLDGQGGPGSYLLVTFTGSWQRVSTTYSYASAYSQNSSVRVGVRDMGVGQGTATYMYVWGAQVEDGYAPTSYIPTSGSSVTRAADTSTSAAQTRAADVYSSSQVTRSAERATISGTNFTSWFNQSEGTLYAEGLGQPSATATSGGNAATIVNIDTGTSENGLPRLVRNNGATGRYAYYFNGAYTTQFTDLGSWPNSTIGKIVGSYKLNDFAASFNGQTVQSYSTGIVRTADQINIGRYASDGYWNSTIKKIAYYPKRLSNAELVSITAQ